MSYQVLARKWRPRQFSELVGQQHVKLALANALNSSRLHHAYLFTGTRGVGKTTIARIFAKSLNCETGVTATPCGQCAACVEIDAGNFVDLMEIDAASRTKVEDTRDLLDNVQYAPSRGRFKVYLIDEVHMLSRHSFNALLKTLEEPPPHVKFLLATTDPQKLPITVLSRCLQFSLKALSVTQIAQHLTVVLQQEQIAFDDAAVMLLAKAAKGSLRDALSLTDQAIAVSDSHLTLEPVRQMLGLLDTCWSVQLLSALLSADMQALQQALQALLSLQADGQNVLDDMLSLLHLAAITQLQPRAADLSEQAEFIQQLASQQTPEALQLFYQLLVSGKKDLPYAPDPVIGLEMALLRAIAFVPATASASTNGSGRTRDSAPIMTVSQTDRESDRTIPAVSAGRPAATASVNHEPEAAKTVSTPTPGLPQASASGIDPLTAGIMQRRGVTLPAGVQLSDAETKKFERQTALSASEGIVNPMPVASTAAKTSTSSTFDYAANTDSAVNTVTTNLLIPEDSYADDSVSLADQHALNEAWWQQQEFVTLAPVTPDELDAQRFSIRFAAQVDPWARLIEQLPVGGLMRLYLLNSAMQQEGSTVHLTVLKSQQHLDNDGFRQKLFAAISPVFAAGFTLTIQYQTDVSDTPLMIQQRIEQERKAYVSRLLQQDPNIIALQQRFAAELHLDSLQVN